MRRLILAAVISCVASSTLAAEPKGTNAASAKNTEGLELRRSGDHAGAVVAFRAALEASDKYVPARYNLACELALGLLTRDEALTELEALAALGTPEAKRYLVHAKYDPDFIGVAAEPRLAAVLAQVTFDPTKPFARQLCDDPARITALIDPSIGYVDHVEHEGSIDTKASITTNHVRRIDAIEASLAHAQEITSSMCMPEGPPGQEGSSLWTFLLTRAAADRDVVCMTYDGQMEWSSHHLACVVRTTGGWRLASLATWPLGLGFVEPNMQKRMRAARDQGLALFGKTMADAK